MPTLSMFYGIIIRMQSERGGKHHKPHIHCLYGDAEVVVALDGEVLEGSLPAKQRGVRYAASNGKNRCSHEGLYASRVL